MKKRSAFGLVVIVAVVTLAAFAGRPLPETPVASTLAGNGILQDGTVANFRWQSDLSGDYTNNVDGVISRLQGGTIGTGAGDWELDTSGSTARALVVDLREPVPGSGANPPFPYATVHARFISKCHQVTPASIGGMKGLNSTLNCPVIFRFDIGSDIYRLVMDRAGNASTNDMLVTCTDVTGDPADPNSPCSGWSATPSVTDSTGARNVATLTRQYTVKGKAVTEQRGYFYIRFDIRFHR